MVASMVGLILLSGLMAVVLQSIAFADTILIRVALNAQAREVFRLYAEGGRPVGGTAAPVPGFRGSAREPAIDPAIPAADQLALGHVPRLSRPEGTVVGTLVAPVSVVCTGAGLPVLGCAGAGAVVAVDGYLARPPEVVPSVDARFGWAEVAIELVEPSALGNRRVLPGDARQRYRFRLGAPVTGAMP